MDSTVISSLSMIQVPNIVLLSLYGSFVRVYNRVYKRYSIHGKVNIKNCQKASIFEATKYFHEKNRFCCYFYFSSAFCLLFPRYSWEIKKRVRHK
jgi:hypothetical protein